MYQNKQLGFSFNSIGYNRSQFENKFKKGYLLIILEIIERLKGKI